MRSVASKRSCRVVGEVEALVLEGWAVYLGGSKTWLSLHCKCCSSDAPGRLATCSVASCYVATCAQRKRTVSALAQDVALDGKPRYHLVRAVSCHFLSLCRGTLQAPHSMKGVALQVQRLAKPSTDKAASRPSKAAPLLKTFPQPVAHRGPVPRCTDIESSRPGQSRASACCTAHGCTCVFHRKGPVKSSTALLRLPLHFSPKEWLMSRRQKSRTMNEAQC